MSNGGSIFVSFIFGCAVGAITSWYFTRDHYKGTLIEVKSSDDKIKSDVKVEQKMNLESKKPANKEEELYKGIIARNSYSAYYSDKKKESENPNVAPPDPEKEEEYIRQKETNPISIIAPEDFGEFPDWSTISLTFYKDGYLVDDSGNIVEDIDGTVGSESLSHFGDYADNILFVRNVLRECDYEIMFIDQNYTDVVRM